MTVLVWENHLMRYGKWLKRSFCDDEKRRKKNDDRLVSKPIDCERHWHMTKAKTAYHHFWIVPNTRRSRSERTKKNIWKHWTFIACNEAFKRARKGENKRLNVAIRQLNIFTSLKWNDWMPTITIRIIVKYRHHHITKSHSHKCTPYNKIK